MKRTLVAASVGLAIVAAFLWFGSAERGLVLYSGGPILTMDGRSSVAEALLTDGDRIVAVGPLAAVREALAGRESERVDLRGRALLPGFIDAHGHFPGSGMYEVVADLNSPPIGEVGSLDDIVERLQALDADSDSGEWVVGMGYDDSLIAEHRHPTRWDLDRASTEHPVAAVHISGHLGVLSSKGLEACGITAATEDPEGGVIVRDAAGVPTGVLEEEALQMCVADLLTPGFSEAWTMLRAANSEYLAQGVTTAQSGFTNRSFATALAAASRLGLIDLRLMILPDLALAEDFLSGDFDFERESPWLRHGAIKMVADGSIQGYTGYLSEPYHVPPGDDPSYRGYPRIARDDLIANVEKLHAAGLQMAIHGNGDASIEDILDAIELAQGKHPRADARPIVIHAQMTREDQLDRMRRLGVIPSFFVLHTYYWGDRHRDIFMGPARAARMSPTRSAADRGIRFTIHTDTPVVPMEPLRLVWSAVNRRSSSGQLIGPEQRISAIEALRAVTIDAAYQHYLEDQIGSLEAGKLADMVILDRSPLERPDRIDSITVEETIIGGNTLYRREGTGME